MIILLFIILLLIDHLHGSVLEYLKRQLITLILPSIRKFLGDSSNDVNNSSRLFFPVAH